MDIPQRLFVGGAEPSSGGGATWGGRFPLMGCSGGSPTEHLTCADRGQGVQMGVAPSMVEARGEIVGEAISNGAVFGEAQPNKRLELPARGEYGMNQSSARRSSGAIR